MIEIIREREGESMIDSMREYVRDNMYEREYMRERACERESVYARKYI